MKYETKEEFYQVFGKNIKKIRKSHGMTQQQLGERIGCNDSMVSQIETGGKGTGVYNLYKIAQILGVQPQILMPYGEIEDISKDKRKMIKDFKSVLNEADNSDLLKSVMTILALLANAINKRKLDKKIEKLRGMNMNIENIIDGILKP